MNRATASAPPVTADGDTHRPVEVADDGVDMIDWQRLRDLHPDDFRQRAPFPWHHFAALIPEHRYRALRRSLPPAALFDTAVGRRRRYGQQSHDRYVLDYHRHLDVAPIWHALVAAMESDPYRRAIAQLIGTPRFTLSFHWHYTPGGCSVSPHCDADWKLGSHIFYFNTHDDWREQWGGATLVLDDGGRLPYRSAPSFDDFDQAQSTPCVGNHSLLFARTDHSWHGVAPLACPDGALRKVFIAEFRKDRPLNRIRSLLGV